MHLSLIGLRGSFRVRRRIYTFGHHRTYGNRCFQAI
jgi:hypothetical protein